MLSRKEVFSPGEVARLWDVPTRSVLRLIRTGQLPALRFNRRLIRISRADVEAFIASARARVPNSCQLNNSPRSVATPVRESRGQGLF